MFSQQGNTILDPFYGLGTTAIAAMLTGRNSIGVEIDNKLRPTIIEKIENLSIDELNSLISSRYHDHLKFIKEREQSGKTVKHENKKLKCKVMTSQEVDLALFYLELLLSDKT